MPGTPVPTTPGRGKRGVYITVGQQLKLGATEGCPGCHCSDDDPKPRNKECRARFEPLIAKERETKDPAKDVEMGAGVWHAMELAISLQHIACIACLLASLFLGTS